MLGGEEIREQVPPRHPEHRIAVVIPWLGSSFPVWMNFFVESCKSNRFLVDWLIFHEGADLPSNIASNVQFIDVKEGGLAALHASKIGLSLGLSPDLTTNLSTTLADAFRTSSYLIVDFKPTIGTVFQEFLGDYSHWSWGDLDMVIGDLAGWVQSSELAEFDVFTYSFGDNDRLYTRGQLTVHRNAARINHLWKLCTELSTEVIMQALQHTGITERCYSYAVAMLAQDVKVKYVTKAFTDFGDPSRVFLFDRQVALCSDVTTAAELTVCKFKLAQMGPQSKSELIQSHWSLNGKMLTEPMPLNLSFTDVPCADWWTNFRVCVVFPEDYDPKEYSVILYNQVPQAFRSRRAPPAVEGVEDAAFFHFQQWKSQPQWKRGKFKYARPGNTIASSNTELMHLDGYVTTSKGMTPLGVLSVK